MPQADLPEDLPRPGDRILEKFRIERVLGQGGAGVVYAAHHELLDQPIALKLLLAEPGSEAAARFVNEAKLAARIHSEHVCRVMDVGTLPSGVPYIAMEYLEGRDLDTVLAAGALPVHTVADYIIQALDAIAQAHAQGIIHRDLKPANLYLALRPGSDQPIIKVLDFGISKGDMLGSDTNVTSSRAILGSPSYMSPEQIKNARTVDARTDVWSVGVILYELMSGRPPFAGETVGEVFAKIIEGEPPPLREIVPHVPEEFENTVRRCLAKDREERFANVAELAEALGPLGTASSSPLVARIRGAIAPAASPSSRSTLDVSKPRDAEKSVVSATAAPWTEAPVAPKRRGRLLVLPLTFILGGASVYFLALRPPASVAPYVPATSIPSMPSAMASAIEALGIDGGAITFTSVSSIPSEADAQAADADADANVAETIDAGEADGGDGGAEDDDDDDETEATGPDAGKGAVHPKKPAHPRPPGAKPGKKRPGKKRR
jgi:serine/threonine-protein kinase